MSNVEFLQTLVIQDHLDITRRLNTSLRAVLSDRAEVSDNSTEMEGSIQNAEIERVKLSIDIVRCIHDTCTPSQITPGSIVYCYTLPQQVTESYF